MWGSPQPAAQLQSTSPHYWERCPNWQVGSSDWVHRKSEGFLRMYRMSVSTNLSFVTRNAGRWWPRTPAPTVHRAGVSWWPCSAGGDRWPWSGHRPSLLGARCPVLQRAWKNTPGWCTLHRLWLCSVSGYSTASLGWWWR